MVLEVLTDAWKLRHQINTGIREDVLRADTTVEQDRRAADTASRDNNLPINLDRGLCLPAIGRILDRVRRQFI